ncbi:hypothetical protein GE09DRAFT_674441 [Coniochaeta sp. 2T2.1]|nr:hypothetical protein GE09DRAFT_674441 [Coniochaeta sp. 2T2.1]
MESNKEGRAGCQRYDTVLFCWFLVLEAGSCEEDGGESLGLLLFGLSLLAERRVLPGRQGHRVQVTTLTEPHSFATGRNPLDQWQLPFPSCGSGHLPSTSVISIDESKCKLHHKYQDGLEPTSEPVTSLTILIREESNILLTMPTSV